MPGRRGRGGDTPGQFLIDWTAGDSPAPTEAAIDAGVISDDDLSQQNIRAVHDVPAQPAHAQRVTTGRELARLPAPKPLPAAVRAAHFGRNERDRPIRPSPDAVRAITENRARKLIDLLLATPHAAPPGRDFMTEEYRSGLAAYAEDFGEPATRQLEAYVQRQAESRQPRSSPKGHRR